MKEDLQKELEREPTEEEIGDATNMSVTKLRKAIEFGQAARNKLIKVIQIVRFFYSLAFS